MNSLGFIVEVVGFGGGLGGLRLSKGGGGGSFCRAGAGCGVMGWGTEKFWQRSFAWM